MALILSEFDEEIKLLFPYQTENCVPKVDSERDARTTLSRGRNTVPEALKISTLMARENSGFLSQWRRIELSVK